jgi:hypothetical protein
VVAFASVQQIPLDDCHLGLRRLRVVRFDAATLVRVIPVISAARELASATSPPPLRGHATLASCQRVQGDRAEVHTVGPHECTRLHVDRK